jgi:hypothetical protein
MVMTKSLEEFFNLPESNEDDANTSVELFEEDLEPEALDPAEIKNALTLSEKINDALKEVQDLADHESEMTDIGREALQSYKDLMQLGMNVRDEAAGSIFNQAANMLKIALEASDAKVARKLKQIDLMQKQRRIELQEAKNRDDDDDDPEVIRAFDRNELLKALKKKD